MLRLNLAREPRWVTLPSGVEILVAPVTSLIMALARSSDAYLALPETVGRDVHYTVLASEVARLVIQDWRGVVDDEGAPMEVSETAVAALMDLNSVNAEFAAMVLTPYLLLVEEKKGFAPLPTGISAGAPITAGDAEVAAPIAATP